MRGFNCHSLRSTPQEFVAEPTPRFLEHAGHETEILEDVNMNSSTSMGARVAVYIGRSFLGLALFALLGAWITQLTGGPILGMSQEHLFNDAMVLALLGIGMFLDGLWHARSV